MNKINFLNIELEYNEKVFRPTLLSEKCAINTNFKNKNILDLGCGIGPLAIYFAKNGATSVDAIDIYDEHLKFAKKNSDLNEVRVNVFESNLFCKTFRAAIAIAGAVPLPKGSNKIAFGLTSISRICSATRNLCSSLQIKIVLEKFLKFLILI